MIQDEASDLLFVSSKRDNLLHVFCIFEYGSLKFD